MSNVLNDLAAEFERLRARKEELEEQTKANNQALRKKEDMAKTVVDNWREFF